MLDAVRLKTFLASKHYCQNSLGLLFANRQGRPFSANKLREKSPAISRRCNRLPTGPGTGL